MRPDGAPGFELFSIWEPADCGRGYTLSNDRRAKRERRYVVKREVELTTYDGVCSCLR
jgi:hypothetical protein